jgi:DNA-binding transcriptional LysR family regulator
MWLVAPPDWAGPDSAETVPVVTIARFADVDVWSFETAGQARELKLEYRLVLSSLTMVRDAALAGTGAALLPRSLVRQDIEVGRLALWGTYNTRPVEIWALHSSRRLVSPKVSAFMAFLRGFVA